MFKNLGVFFLASGLVMTPFASADNGSDEISKEETKILIEDSMTQQPNHDNQMKSRNIDEKALTTRVTNRDRDRKAKLMEVLKAEKNQPGNTQNINRFEDFFNKCGAHPTYKMDIALMKDFDEGTDALPTDQIFEGLGAACYKPINKAWVQKIKSIHWKLAKKLKDPNMYNLDFEPKKGELTIEVRKYGPENISDKLRDWVSNQ